jgi:hypothetical protein
MAWIKGSMSARHVKLETNFVPKRNGTNIANKRPLIRVHAHVLVHAEGPFWSVRAKPAEEHAMTGRSRPAPNAHDALTPPGDGLPTSTRGKRRQKGRRLSNGVIHKMRPYLSSLKNFVQWRHGTREGRQEAFDSGCKNLILKTGCDDHIALRFIKSDLTYCTYTQYVRLSSWVWA